MRALFGFLVSLSAPFALSQTYTISTFAGGGLPINIAGPTASLGRVASVAVDPSGNVFFALQEYNAVLRLNPATGTVTPVAGNGSIGYSGDNGPATNAQLSAPWGVAVDSVGNLYIADSGNHRVRKVSNGIITTFAGGGAEA